MPKGVYTRTKEHGRNISKANKGRKLSKEHRKSLSEATKGEKNHFFGKKHTPSTLKKMSMAHIKNPTKYWLGKKRPIGEDSAHWLGDNVGYHGVHEWIKKLYGKASKCENRENQVLNFKCRRISKSYHWAKKRESGYTRNPEDYYQLCSSCHHIYDKI